MLTAYLPAAKMVTQIVAGLGVSKIVTGIVKNNVVITTTAQKVLVSTGSAVLGSMLVEQASNHVEKVADEVASWFADKNPVAETPES